MEDEFYHLTVKGNDLKTYVRRFQELATLCPTMVSNFKKMMEAFIERLPRSIEGNICASKPQTLEEAINIAQRLLDQSSSGPALNEITPATISSGLVQKSSSSTPYVPPSRNDWDLLFQPMFDKLLNPSPSVDHQAPKVIAPIADVIPLVQTESTGFPFSTTVDQDTPSPRNDPLFDVPIPEVISAQSSSTVSPHLIVQPDHQIPQQNTKWTKDHPLNNIIGPLSRPVSTRLQLHEQALFCYYNAFLTSVEPKTYKEALNQSCWIEAMQEELNEFERLEVWELVPRPDKVMVENGVIKLYFVNTEYQLADLFTKALGRDRIEFLINKLGMRSFTPETLKQLMDEINE
nr:reverse transcriptase domain-containing protein [Tanacetum cinerariifolium]